MPRVGDGTGTGSMPPEKNKDDFVSQTPEKPGKGAGAGDGGTGAKLESGGNRKSPL